MYRGTHSELISDRGPWYTPRSRDLLSPSLLEETIQPSRAPAPRQAGRHRKRGNSHARKPARKINPGRITAATLTALLAIPVLWIAIQIMAGGLAGQARSLCGLSSCHRQEESWLRA